jgi:hypothetical protein
LLVCYGIGWVIFMNLLGIWLDSGVFVLHLSLPYVLNLKVLFFLICHGFGM